MSDTYPSAVELLSEDFLVNFWEETEKVDFEDLTVPDEKLKRLCGNVKNLMSLCESFDAGQTVGALDKRYIIDLDTLLLPNVAQSFRNDVKNSPIKPRGYVGEDWRSNDDYSLQISQDWLTVTKFNSYGGYKTIDNKTYMDVKVMSVVAQFNLTTPIDINNDSRTKELLNVPFTNDCGVVTGIPVGYGEAQGSENQKFLVSTVAMNDLVKHSQQLGII